MKYIALIFLLLTACATAPKSVARIPFSEVEAEYVALPKTGTGIVTGQAFLKTRGGDVKTAAGNEVMLNPVTSYSMQWYQVNYISGTPLEPIDERVRKYLIVKTADGSGRFTFKNVPPGDYFVVSQVTWQAATGYQGSLVTQGGIVAKRITVRDGEETEVIVTR